MAEISKEKKTAQLVAMLAEAFGRACTPLTFKAYEMGLGDLELSAIEHGVRRAINESKFMPSCSELRALCGVLPIADRALRAWDELNRAISHAGYYRSVAFADPATAATVRNMGGWTVVCDQAAKPATEWETWSRKKFIGIYESVCNHGCSPEMVGPLLGQHDQVNGFTDERNLAVINTNLPRLASLPAPVLRLGSSAPKQGDQPKLLLKKAE